MGNGNKKRGQRAINEELEPIVTELLKSFGSDLGHGVIPINQVDKLKVMRQEPVLFPVLSESRTHETYLDALCFIFTTQKERKMFSV